MQANKTFLAIAIAFSGAAAQAVELPDSISFDGFCDGFTGAASIGNGVYSATHDFTVCNENGGSYTNEAAVGPKGGHLISGKVGIAYTESSFTQFGATYTYVINGDHTWYLLAPEFGGIANLGTWTEGYPPQAARAAAGTKSTLSR